MSTTGFNILDANTLQGVVAGVAVATITAGLLTVAGSLTINKGTITASTPTAFTSTWNNSGVTFKAFTISVTDQAANAGSASGSLLIDLLCGTAGTTSVFSVSKNGSVVVNTGGRITSGSDIYTASTGGLVFGIRSFIDSPADGNLRMANAANNDFTRLQLGGTTASFPAIGRSGVSIAIQLADGTLGSFLTPKAAANIQFGAADAASPVAQTLSVQNVVAGTSNTAGANLTIVGSLNTGSGAPGDVVMQTGQVGGSGTSQSAAVTAFTLRRGTAVLASYAVAGLPSASSAGAGATAFVTDASTTLILGLGLAVSGGGANKVPVYSDGTNWLYG